MHPSPSATAAEVEALRQDLQDLRLEVQELARLIAPLVNNNDFADSASGFTLVRDTGYSADSSQSATTGNQGQQGQSSVGTDFSVGSEQRNTIIRQVGRFLASALRDNHRGDSGRDALPLRSQLWVVLRGYNGQTFQPARVFRRWGLAKDLVKRGTSLGESVFVGLPAESDCRLALQTAGVAFPDVIEG